MDIQAIWNWIAQLGTGQWQNVLMLAVGFVCIREHNRDRLPKEVLGAAIPTLCITVYLFYGLYRTGEKVPVVTLASVLYAYSASLYVACGELLQRYGWAKYYCEVRGENWPKEIDYVYLSLGTLGILGTINRIESVTDHYSNFDIFAPLILATAVTLRFIKTRAEVKGWNKLSMWAPPTAAASTPPAP